MASATPRFTVDVVFPTPPFWFATVTTRIRPGAGNGSCSAACSTRVARIASIAIGLSNSTPTAAPTASSARLERSRSPGSVIGASSPAPRSTWNRTRLLVRVPRETGSSRRASGPGGTATRHDDHGSGCRTQLDADGPRVDVPHAGGFQFRDEIRDLCGRPGAHQSDQLGSRDQQPPTPADETGQRRDRPGGDDVD